MGTYTEDVYALLKESPVLIDWLMDSTPVPHLFTQDYNYDGYTRLAYIPY